MSHTNVTQILANPRTRRTHTHIFTKVLMGFAWDTHTYKDQKSQWHIYGGLINVSKVAIGGKEYWYCKKILVLA